MTNSETNEETEDDTIRDNIWDLAQFEPEVEDLGNLRKTTFNTHVPTRTTEPYVEDASYEDWVEKITKNETKCPDYQESSTKNWNSSGFAFSFLSTPKSLKGTSNQKVALEKFEGYLSDNASSGSPNATATFFFCSH